MSMTLSQLVAGLPGVTLRGDGATRVTGLATDSRRVRPGDLFFALKGAHADGTEFVPQAVENGAVAVAGADAWSLRPTTPLLVLDDERDSVAGIARRFHGEPDAGMQVVGVTGTNGKTTTAFLVKHLLASAGVPCGLIGTVRYEIGSRVLPAPHTTPMACELYALLRQMADAGCRAVAMEVSSHALEQGRVRHLAFDAGVFTNLTQDHLDFHGNMDAYYAAKRRLFAESGGSAKPFAAVVNRADAAGMRLLQDPEVRGRKLGVGEDAGADVRWTLHGWTPAGADLTISWAGEAWRRALPLFGRFNVENATCAVAAALALGISLEQATGALETAPPVPGRLEPVPHDRGFSILVDYAHTDDALRKALTTLRELPHGRIVLVFGCGGDRDRTKRPLMGRVAAELADQVFLTSDNPRTENPAQIMADVLAGMPDAGRVVVEADRRTAIRLAVADAQPGDIVLIAGKGHETYQEIHGVRQPLDDREEAAKAVKAL
jgi:UDP-N-acetylmuramoyl-L-alanyl-D-glutamate--2,6-diaminopimelate ligase